jgi:two-component system phosphate regulon sensor histidine kinase PhoR
MEKVRVAPLLENVLATFSQRLQAKGLTAALESPSRDITVEGDPFRLEQLFMNLIDNAVKYTEQGGITITLGNSGDSALIRVADTGLGIAKEHHERIFERFYVVDKSRSRRLGGTGLGLSIVKHIAGLHRGSVTVDSRPYGGTTFTVTLPLAA